LEQKSPRGGLKIEPFRERATSRYGEGAKLAQAAKDLSKRR
jgi:hypothetical protein